MRLSCFGVAFPSAVLLGFYLIWVSWRWDSSRAILNIDMAHIRVSIWDGDSLLKPFCWSLFITFIKRCLCSIVTSDQGPFACWSCSSFNINSCRHVMWRPFIQDWQYLFVFFIDTLNAQGLFKDSQTPIFISKPSDIKGIQTDGDRMLLHLTAGRRYDLYLKRKSTARPIH